MTENKRFIVIDVPYENGEPFLYKKMLDKTTKKEYDNTLKGIDDMCDLANKLHKENKKLKQRIKQFENYKEASDKFTKEVEDFFERHEIDGVNFDIVDTVFEGFEFYSDQYDELKKQNKELEKENAQFDILIKNNQLAYIDLEKENEQLKSTIKCLEADKMELQQYIKRMQGDVE